ncbi:MAG TPA: hypothetical protein VF198_11200 [Vicinamibacterales bacterium]
MPEFVLRFSGRFVFVEQPSDVGPVVQALAVDMTFNRDVASAPHRALMAAPRVMVDHLGTRSPDLTLMPSPNAAIDQTNHERLEQVVWELAGLDLEIDRGSGEPFRWQDRSMLFDMQTVLGASARLRDDVLGPGPAGGPVSASVRMVTGIGDARQIAERTADFVRLNAPLGEPALSGLKLADYVDVRVVVPTEDPSLVIRVRRRGAPGPVSAIVLQADPDIPTVVSFSNLCARVSASAHDTEFAAFYEVFEGQDLVRTRLVPRVRETLFGKSDCFAPVYLQL